jgi:hypothetical protein
MPDGSFSARSRRPVDGRSTDLPGVMCYGKDRNDAIARVQALALRVIAERLEHQEAPADLLYVTFRVA